MGSGPADLGSNPGETTSNLQKAGEELLPIITDALAEIEQGSALQAKAILEALQEAFL